MKIKIISIISASLISMASFTQVSDIGKFFAGGADDAEKLVGAYMEPYFDAFGTSLTGGWYNTAKPHKLGGFDVTFTFNTAIVPSSAKSFDVSSLGLTSLEAKDETSTPTIAGANSTGVPLVYKGTGVIDGESAFEMPKGTGFGYIPSPMLQLGIGLIKNTEITGRYMPTYSSGDAKIGMWGIGGMHDIKQWIPGVKKLPVLNMSIQYGFTKMNSEIGLNVAPSDIGAGNFAGANSSSWDNQKMEFITKSHTGNFLVSANLPVVCFYGGIGFASTSTNLKLKGDYPSVGVNSDDIVPVAEVLPLTDPIDITVINSDGKKTKARYNVGMRFKFAIVTLNFDYTYSTYNMITAGLGISFR